MLQEGVISKFMIPSMYNHDINNTLYYRYIDPQRTLLKLRVKITDEKGKAYAADKVVGFVNYPLGTLFSDVKVELNQTQINSSTHMQHYRCYFETLFSFNEVSKKSHLTSGLFVQDAAGEFDSLTGAANVARAKYTAAGKEVELLGRLHTDLCSQQRLILNETNIRFTFVRNDPSIVCIGSGGLKPKVEITDASLYIRKCTINPSVLLAHAKMLQDGTTAKWPMRKVELYNYSIAQGVQRTSLEGLFQQRIPSRIILGFLESTAFNGDVTKSPYNFKNFGLNMVSFSIDGQIINGKPLTPDFTNGHYMESFCNSYINTGNFLIDDGHCVARDDYGKDGYPLWAIDLTPDFSASEAAWSLQAEGSCRLEIGFSAILPVVTTCVMYCEFRNVMQATKEREYSLEYLR